MDLTQPLGPTNYILHLPYNQSPIGRICDKAWQSRISDCLRRLRDAGIQSTALSIETLNYPLEWIEQILREYDLRVCLDMGHLIVNHENIETTYHRFAGQTTMIHLHGVNNGKDHLALDVFDQRWLDKIFSLLKQFTGTVSIEVFSFNHLLDFPCGTGKQYTVKGIHVQSLKRTYDDQHNGRPLGHPGHCAQICTSAVQRQYHHLVPVYVFIYISGGVLSHSPSPGFLKS